jgi:hypothetical protein
MQEWWYWKRIGKFKKKMNAKNNTKNPPPRTPTRQNVTGIMIKNMWWKVSQLNITIFPKGLTDWFTNCLNTSKQERMQRLLSKGRIPSLRRRTGLGIFGRCIATTVGVAGYSPLWTASISSNVIGFFLKLVMCRSSLFRPLLWYRGLQARKVSRSIVGLNRGNLKGLGDELRFGIHGF